MTVAGRVLFAAAAQNTLFALDAQKPPRSGDSGGFCPTPGGAALDGTERPVRAPQGTFTQSRVRSTARFQPA